MRKLAFKSRAGLYAALLTCTVVALAATWTMAKPDNATAPSSKAREAQTDGASKAYLTVSNMSCGGCVDTITKSLTGLSGIVDVYVDVAGGTAEVRFDAALLKDHQELERTITAAGYPATISRILEPQEVERERTWALQRAKTHIASVGKIDIAREDYALEMEHARKRYEQVYAKDMFTTPQGQQLAVRLKSQIAQRLIDEGIKLQEVERAGFQISDETIGQALDQYVKARTTTLDQFKTDLKVNDYSFEYFYKKFSRKVRLQRYLESQVLADCVDDNARQQAYRDWLTNARSLAKVKYYDRELEKLVKATSTSSCSGGASCSKAAR